MKKEDAKKILISVWFLFVAGLEIFFGEKVVTSVVAEVQFVYFMYAWMAFALGILLPVNLIVVLKNGNNKKN